jgi:hypothetical protein
MIAKNHNSRTAGCVNSFVACGVAAVLALMSPSSVAQEASTSAVSSPQYVKESLCTQPDQIVLSCPLAKNGKIVSVCATGNASPHAFYYAFGRPGALEMHYPNDPSASNNNDFSRALLSYSQGMAGYAYSFVNNGVKYIIYTISGKFGYERAGVMVQKTGSLHAMTDMQCSKGKFQDTSDDPLIDETLKMKKDDDLDIHGLPLTN